MQNKKLGEKMASKKLKREKLPTPTQKKLSAIILACSLELAMPPLTQPVAFSVVSISNPVALASEVR